MADAYTTVRDTVVGAVAKHAPMGEQATQAVQWFFVLAALWGVFVGARLVLSMLRAFLTTFCRRSHNLKRYGQWAVVTGATDGIGKAYAIEFAKKGMNVLIISRHSIAKDSDGNELTDDDGNKLSKLEKVKAEIEDAAPKATVDTHVIDFANFTAEDLAETREVLSELDIGVLVNNVGVNWKHPKYFTEAELADTERVVDVNVIGTVRMTHMVLPGMLKNKRGAILNVSSATGVLPAALQTAYGGTKAFLNQFTEGLAQECGPKGVHVQCVIPLLVSTKLSRVRPNVFIPTAKAFARASIANIGHDNFVVPYWSHALQLWLATSLPRWAQGSYMFGMHNGLRKRALRKAAKLKEKTH